MQKAHFVAPIGASTSGAVAREHGRDEHECDQRVEGDAVGEHAAVDAELRSERETDDDANGHVDEAAAQQDLPQVAHVDAASRFSKQRLSARESYGG